MQGKKTNKQEQQEIIKQGGYSVGLEYNRPKRIHNYRIFNIMFCLVLFCCRCALQEVWVFLAAVKKELDPAIVL